jgi:hypothetical protein
VPPQLVGDITHTDSRGGVRRRISIDTERLPIDPRLAPIVGSHDPVQAQVGSYRALALGLPIPDALLDGAEVRAVDADISGPVIFGERSLARKTARSATSWGVMNRPVGCKLGDNEARFLPADLGHREESAIGESTRERRPCHGGRAATSGAR